MEERVDLGAVEDGLDNLEYLTNPYFREIMYEIIDELRLYRSQEEGI